MLLECERCEAIVDAKELSNYEFLPEDKWEKGLPPVRYTFSQCPKCSSPFLAVQEQIWNYWDEPVRIYPPRDKRVDPSWPPTVKKSYQESLNCFKAKAYTATVIMCRKTLEAICSEHKVHQPSLAKSLKSMKDNGLIENRLFEWAEALRIAGNEAAHDVDVDIPRQDAKDILEFTEALLEYVFTFRDRFNEFLKRRDSATKLHKRP